MRYPYEDATLAPVQRALDLRSRMTLEQKVGLMFHPPAMKDLDEPGMFDAPSTRELVEMGIRHFNVVDHPTAGEMAQWHNHLQRVALEQPLGVPVTLSTDPRHSFTENPAMSHLPGPFSQWPEALGFAAVGSTELVSQWAETIREEYRAVGIRSALHPQIDLATEPRWTRQSGTFGANAAVTMNLLDVYIRALQGGDELASAGVAAMAKHFPGGGPQKDGEDPHFPTTAEQVYPGGNFQLHLAPFRRAIEAGVAQIMPYYGVPTGTEYEAVGFGFNHDILTGILREELGFDGVICADWWILSRLPWGVEDLTYEERMLKALDAGVDQFGGEWRAESLAGLVRSGRILEARIDDSVRRLLTVKFQSGVFDETFVDEVRATELVGGPAARQAGLSAQAAAHVLLKNDIGQAALPLGTGMRLYVEGLDTQLFDDRATIVSTPQEADVAVLRLAAPWEHRGMPGDPESYFHSGSLEFHDAEIARVNAVSRLVPTILNLYLDRPAILAPVTTEAASVLGNFGTSDAAAVAVLFGDQEPEGTLPFEIPSSMEAVRRSNSDTPSDTENPTYPYGFGRRFGSSN